MSQHRDPLPPGFVPVPSAHLVSARMPPRPSCSQRLRAGGCHVNGGSCLCHTLSSSFGKDRRGWSFVLMKVTSPEEGRGGDLFPLSLALICCAPPVRLPSISISTSILESHCSGDFRRLGRDQDEEERETWATVQTHEVLLFSYPFVFGFSTSLYRIHAPIS